MVVSGSSRLLVGGGLLYYCPTPGAIAEITITDANGNKTVILISPETPLGEGDVVGEAGPNPFDPKVDESMNIRVTLNVSAHVTVKIYDMGGDLVTTLRSDALMNAGDNLCWLERYYRRWHDSS